MSLTSATSLGPAPVPEGTNSISAPVAKGQQVRIPAGTVVRSTNPSKRRYVTSRAQTITVHHVLGGWIDLWNDHKRGMGYVILPVVVWPGTGGYWCEVKVTPEMCAAWGGPPLTLPALGRYDLDRLDAEPSFGPGYDNRDLP